MNKNYVTMFPRSVNVRFAAALFIGMRLCSTAWAEKIGWHDQMSLHAGDGMDLKNQMQAKQRQVVVMGADPVRGGPTGDASESVTFAQHTFNLVNSLSINASISLRGLVSSGDAGVSFISNKSSSGNSLNYVFTATRNFGDAYYPITGGFSPDFNAIVAELRKTYSGAALHGAITNIFGTHIVTGIRSAAMVSVIFSFDYGSASLAQQLNASAGGTWTMGDFSSQVSSFFSSKDTRRKVQYSFYSSDPNQSPTNFNFATSGNITNYDQFSAFIAKVESYWWSMSSDPSKAKTTSYILDPIQNIPGYLSLLGGYAPAAILSPDYNTFLQVYAALQAWNQRLTDWTINPNKMSWFNGTGQRLALAKRQDVADYLAALEAIAADHFLKGSPLTVPNDIFNYLSSLSNITIPSLNVAWASDDTVYSYYHGVIGWVDCGSISNALAVPFTSVSEPKSGTDVGWLTPLAYSYHDVTNLVKAQISYWYSASSGNLKDLNQFFNSTTWANLTNAAFSSRRIGFFADQRAKADKTNTFMVISDAAGNVVDELNWLSTRSGPVPEAKSLGAVKVSALTPELLQGTVGLKTSVPLVITNDSDTSAHGVAVSFKLAQGFDFWGSSGSQGYAKFDPTTRLVTYVAGPLPPGGQANAAVEVIPLQPDPLLASTNAVLAVGDALTNLATPQINMPQVSSELPILTLAKATKGIELSWLSDTDRLKAYQATRVGPGASWTMVSATPVADGNKRTLMLPVSPGSTFYRLKMN